MNILEFAKECIKQIEEQTALEVELNQYNQIQVNFDNNNSFLVEIQTIWEDYQTKKEQQLLDNFIVKQIKILKKMSNKIQGSSFENDKEKLFVKIAGKNKIDFSKCVTKKITSDLIAVIAVDEDEFIKYTLKDEYKNVSENELWNVAVNNSKNRLGTEPIVTNETEVYGFEYYSNAIEDISFQFIDPEYVEKNYKDKFFVMPDEEQIVIYDIKVRDKREKIKVLNFIKKKIENLYKTASKPYSDKVYYYDDSNKLKEL